MIKTKVFEGWTLRGSLKQFEKWVNENNIKVISTSHCNSVFGMLHDNFVVVYEESA